LKITIKKYKKPNKIAIYLSIDFNVVKIQHNQKIMILQSFFDFLRLFTVLIWHHSYEY